MSYNWLGNTGLVTLISKIKTLSDTKVDKVEGKGLSTNDYTTADKTAVGNIDTKVDKVEGKGLSTNDYTTAEKNKLNGIEDNANNYTLPTASANTLGGVKVGNGLNVTNGVLSVTALGGVTSVNGKTGAVTLSASDVGAYTKNEVDTLVSKVYRYKGVKATVSDLPTSGNVVGDVWDVTENGHNYAWTDNNTWDDLGGTFDTSGLVAKTDMVEITANDVTTAWNTIFV